MSVQRSPSAAGSTDPGSSTTRADASRPRDPAPTRAVDAFREALALARQSARDASATPDGEAEGGRSGAEREQRRLRGEHAPLPGVEAAAQSMHPSTSPEGPGLQSKGPDPQVVAELIERHVRQLFVSEGGLQARGSGDILLRLDDDTLPGTDLVLRREGTRWRLEAQTAHRDVAALIERFAPELSARFAARGLGELQVVSDLRAQA